MAGSVNKVTIIGRLGSDPEVRYTPSGAAVANFSVATSESWNDNQGQRQERTEWHRIVVWGKLAELCNEYLAKGRQVYLEGRLQTRQWDDRDGNKRTTTEIVAREVVFLGGRNDSGGGGGGGGGQSSGGQSSGGQSSGGQSSGGQGGGQGGGQSGAQNRTPANEGYDYGPPPMDDDDVPF